VALGPRADFARLENSPTMRAVDSAPVWSIICFVVPSEYRKQGVAHELLAAAIAFARQHGARQLEAYPVDRDDAAARAAPWFRLPQHVRQGRLRRGRPPQAGAADRAAQAVARSPQACLTPLRDNDTSVPARFER
jgi:GNAT superfamily N-acetyltransferase